MKGLVCCVLMLGLIEHVALAQKSSRGMPDGETVVRNIERQYEGIEDYTVTLTVTVNLERLKVAPMHMTMYFKQPDKIHFDANGFAMLPKQAAAMNFGRLHEHYAVDNRVEPDTADGRSYLRVSLTPKGDRLHIRHVAMDVDPARWTPEKVRIPLLDGRVMNVSVKYDQHEKHWLPSEAVITFVVSQGDSTAPNLLEELAPNRAGPQIREGVVTIRYSDYQLNRGLSDDLFKEDGGQKTEDR